VFTPPILTRCVNFISLFLVLFLGIFQRYWDLSSNDVSVPESEDFSTIGGAGGVVVFGFNRLPIDMICRCGGAGGVVGIAG